MGGGGLYGYFWEYGQPVGAQGCVVFSRSLIPTWNSLNTESVVEMAVKPLLVELIDVAA